MSSREEKDQKSRVFVGNLGPEVTVEDIRQRFEVHGPISNVNKNVKGFAFVQYENEPDAKEAVAKEDGRLFKGKKIDVKPAMRSGEAGGGPQNRPGDAKSGRGPGIVDRRGGSRDRDDRFGPSGGDRGYGGGGGRDFGGSGWGGGGGGGERDFRHGGGGYPPYDGPGRGGRDGYYGGGSDNGGGGYRGGFNEGPPGRGGGMMGPRGGPAPPPSLMDKPNDVEIICMNKHTRVYAEAVEARLKNMGLTVDVLFPNPEIPLGKVLGNIAGRGVMYAVCVSPDNELHRSLTVNVLQGEQQEHRNMPLDEAMSFVGKSFSRFIEKPAGGQLGYATPAAAAASSAADQLPAFGHPNDIRTILGFLIDDRPMSIMEYDKLIKYLATRREGTLKAEYGMNIPAHLLLPPVGPMQDPVLKVFLNCKNRSPCGTLKAQLYRVCWECGVRERILISSYYCINASTCIKFEPVPGTAAFTCFRRRVSVPQAKEKIRTGSP
jgi:hypothetical protein